MWSPTDGNLPCLCLGATSFLVPKTFEKSEILKRDFQLLTIIGMNINGHGKQKLELKRCCWLWVALLPFG